MKVQETNKPAAEAAQQLQNTTGNHDGDRLCLLSGGFALDIIEHIRSTTE